MNHSSNSETFTPAAHGVWTPLSPVLEPVPRPRLCLCHV